MICRRIPVGQEMAAQVAKFVTQMVNDPLEAANRKKEEIMTLQSQLDEWTEKLEYHQREACNITYAILLINLYLRPGNSEGAKSRNFNFTWEMKSTILQNSFPILKKY